MTTGTGLFLLGVWAALGCAFVSTTTTSKAVGQAIVLAIFFTIVALALTVGEVL